MAIQGEIPNELFGYAADEVYEDLTGEDEMPRMSRPRRTPKPLGEEWDFGDPVQNALRLPKLSAKYGGG